MSKVTTLAECHVTAFNMIAIELVEADETPAAIIVRWPAKPSVLHPQRFPDTAGTVARAFASAGIELAAIKARRRL
jgi:hypothetical protein